MTKEDKRDRRRARHEMQALFQKEVMRGGGLYMTPRQLKQRTKILIDRAIKGDIPMPAPSMTLQVCAELSLLNEAKLPSCMGAV